MIALGARFTLVGPDGERAVDAAEMFDVSDGREWIARKPGELLTGIEIPPQGDAKSVYLKLRRREAFDFPVLGVAARLEGNGTVEKADVILNALGPAPIRATEAEQALVGTDGGDEARRAAADLAPKSAKPLDNTDHMPSWRKKIIKVFVRRALVGLRA
jgi:CO/xanthine dehydrogenase FAD-binding subunit